MNYSIWEIARELFFLKKKTTKGKVFSKKNYLFLAVLGLSCDTQDLPWRTWAL